MLLLDSSRNFPLLVSTHRLRLPCEIMQIEEKIRFSRARVEGNPLVKGLESDDDDGIGQELYSKCVED